MLSLATAICINFVSYDAFNESEAGERAIGGIPQDIGIWKGKDMPLEDLIYEILETKSIIHRQYKTENGSEIFLSIVYHSKTKVNFHGPEQCLGGQGIALEKSFNTVSFLSKNDAVELDLVQMIQNQYGNKSLIYYFFKAGDFMGPSYIKLRLNLAMNSLINTTKSASLIRISTPLPLTSSTEQSAVVMNSFLQDLYPYIVQYL